MKPTRLELAGFLGIRDVTLNVPDVPLVALDGPNGAGKTTLLDNLQPYRFLPSRASAPSPSVFSFYEHVGPQASKTLDWEHDGIVYRSVMTWKQTAKTKRGEAYLLRKRGDAYEPVIRSGITSDGKVDTYDRLVIDILGSPQLFCNSAFFAQGRKAISGMRPTDVKAMLAELLDLERFAPMSLAAFRVSKILIEAIPPEREKLAKADILREEIDAKNTEIEDLKAQIAAVQTRQKETRTSAALAQQELSEAAAAEGDTSSIRRRRAELAAAREKIETRAEMDAAATKKEVDRLTAALVTAELQSTTKADQLTKVIAEATAKIEGTTAGIASILAAAEAADAACPGELDRLKALQEQEAAERATEEQRNTLVLAKTTAESDQRAHMQSGTALRETLTGIRGRSALCDRVPCQGTDLQGRCELLGDAVRAREALPQVEADIAAARDSYKATQATIAGLQVQIDALPAPDAGLKANIKATQERITTLQNALRARDSISGHEEHIASLRERAADAKANLDSLDATLTAERQRIQAEQKEANARGDALKAEAETELAKVTAELAALPDVSETSLIAVRQAAVEQAERNVALADDTFVELATKRAAAVAAKEGASKQISAFGHSASRIRRLEDEAAAWGLLSRGLGRDGLVALSIDDAGPALAAIANDLLDACFDGRFSLEILTQEQKADGGQRETLTILVSDSERGGERKDLSLMSGGERTYINEILGVSVGLYRTRHARGAFHTRLSDESDGALDPGKKVAFASLKRKILDIGGFKRELFISHSPEVRDGADEIIQVDAL